MWAEKQVRRENGMEFSYKRRRNFTAFCIFLVAFLSASQNDPAQLPPRVEGKLRFIVCLYGGLIFFTERCEKNQSPRSLRDKFNLSPSASCSPELVILTSLLRCLLCHVAGYPATLLHARLVGSQNPGALLQHLKHDTSYYEPTVISGFIFLSILSPIPLTLVISCTVLKFPF